MKLLPGCVELRYTFHRHLEVAKCLSRPSVERMQMRVWFLRLGQIQLGTE